jgi:predicted flap endonuclease-1-like 5' DNA nuclease
MTAVVRRSRTDRTAAPLGAGSSASIAALANLGPASAQMLAEAGIATQARLRQLGAVAAYVQVKRRHPGASLNLLYALAGALDAIDWRTIRRQRRLELLIAVEDYERRHPARGTEADDLLALRNIGPAMKRDLERLGVRRPAQLARADADRLYLRLQRLTGTRQDPCVWDTFAAAIHQARTGEALPWWHFTRTRKQRQADGSFPLWRPAAGRRR